ncbi:MAG: CDP-glycerol glycerophosphotransferase family protein [Lachnospiraceae bacterium]
MSILLIRIAKIAMKCLYGILKLFPIKRNKVLFLSRQSNGPSLDYTMIQRKLLEEVPKVKMVSICKRADGGMQDKLKFVWGMVRSLYHMATSKVCILDSYWPPISVLTHKKEFVVIQIWHALGKLKQSGYQALDKKGGRSSKIAYELRMHKNYDLIIAGGRAWNPFYCAAFQVEEEKLVNIGLPRIDHLLKEQSEMRERVYRTYPQLKEKPIVLYAPTFRRTPADGWEELCREFDFQRFNLVIKPHPNQQLITKDNRVLTCENCSTIELLAACDHIITDYSSISLEAAILDKRTYYFLYDYEDYMKNNGMNIDLCKEMNQAVFQNAKELMQSIESESYCWEQLKQFKEKYLPKELGTSTTNIVEIIRNKLEVENG